MVWSRERDAERPPLSVILPRLYLGAERDVTQDGLASLGISYVLSVSRCSPQPSFLPCSRYLRIPIDDSLWDDLLPWIPQALHFIDSAMSSGASVLVHCAAGISRSPALAVAYIMYSLGMDLDHAYRFVKERRPSISPNFNFLGQLQHFQGTLSQKTSGDRFLAQTPDSRLPPTDKDVQHEADVVTELKETQAEDFDLRDRTQHSHSEGGAKLSGTLGTLRLTLKQNQTACETQREPDKPATKPTQLQLPTSTASLLDKRKSLTLSLTPLGVCPPEQARDTKTPKSETRRKGPEVKTQQGDAGSCRSHREQKPPCSAYGRGGEAKEEPGLLSPFSFTLNKLLDWGERVLLGGVFMHPVRMGQPALPYRC